MQQNTCQQPQYLFKYSTYRQFVHLKDFKVEDWLINPADTPVCSFWKYIRFLLRNRIQKADSFQTSAYQVLGPGKRAEMEELIKGRKWKVREIKIFIFRLGYWISPILVNICGK